MAGRLTPLVNEYYYHVFNRGVARQAIFLTDKDYSRAVSTFSYYRFVSLPIKYSRLFVLNKKDRYTLLTGLEKNAEKLVEIISFSLMPNHFHFLLKQNHDGGISTFMSKFTNSYSKYFNTKNSRNGPILQGTFKAVLIESEEMLIHVSRYIHLNPIVSKVIDKTYLPSYPWTSLPHYLDNNSRLVNPSIILSKFSTKSDYLDFLYSHVDYGTKIEEIKHQFLDLDCPP